MKTHVILLSVALILLTVAAIALATSEPALAHRCFMGGLTIGTLYFCARPHAPGHYAPPARTTATRSLVVDRAQERKSA